MTLSRIALAAAVLGLAAGSASAQTAAPTPKTDLDGKSGTLSKKLSETHGVIKPKGNVDPDMRVPAGTAGTMPVIKPGALGGGVAK